MSKILDFALVLAVVYGIYTFGKVIGYTDGQMCGYLQGYSSVWEKMYTSLRDSLDNVADSP